MLNEKIIPLELNKILNKHNDKKFKNATILKTSNIFNLYSTNKFEIFVNLEKVNNFRHINKFHESVNNLMQNGWIYCSCAEDSKQRKLRKWGKTNIFFGYSVIFIDFVYKRVLPKLPFIKQIYFLITRGHNRVMSKTEIIGRLISCGFQLEETVEIAGLTYYVTKKVRDPYYDMDPSYGPIFKMKRIGKSGKIISVYKFRTMSPYSEYFQSKIIEENKLDESGKIKDDFRVTFYGKFLRKYWIDELPMIINFLKRELKMVGVRPLSEDYFNRYPKDLQDLRIKTKPGLVPPYYVDLPVSFKEICGSERKYLNNYFNNPIKTDFNYFFKALFNILIKQKRSG